MANLAGTANYMAPEMILRREVDARADMYSLGCMIHEILVGVPPFVASSVQDVLRSHVSAAPKPPSANNMALAPFDAVVMGLLDKEPRRRIAHSTQVAAVFDSLGFTDTSVGLPAPRSYLYRARCHGRGETIRRIEAGLERAFSESGVVIACVGESGVGKTRVLIEATHKAQRNGCEVLAGVCAAPLGRVEQGAPLSAMRSILEGVVDGVRNNTELRQRVFPAGDLALASVLPSVADLTDAPPLLDAMPGPQLVDAAIEECSQVLLNYASQRRLLVALDDIQWADAATLRTLERLCAPRLKPSLAILVACRADEPGPADAWIRRVEAERIPVSRLRRDKTAAIGADLLGVQTIPAAFGGLISSVSEGNPFFVTEYLRAAVDEGLLVRDKRGAWMLADNSSLHTISALALPVSLSDLIAWRLSKLSPPAMRVAQVCSLVGKSTPRSIVDAAAELSDSMRAVSFELDRAHVLREDGDYLVFTHDKIREYLVDSLSDRLRRSLHSQIAGHPADAR